MINSDICHETIVKNTTPLLSYSKDRDYAEWKKAIKEKLIELSGFDLVAANACPPNMQIESEEERDDCRIIRFTFESEVGETVPCYLVIPKLGQKKYPVAITLQGHSSGFHNSIGIKKYPADENYHPRGQFALQAAKQGYIALAIEQRSMGERKPTRANRAKNDSCRFAGHVALMLGRTLLAERVWDISRAIDLLENFEVADTDKIVITGNSGGGTASFYAACLEERIKICAPSCAFCPYPESILDIFHCICNYIPSAYRYFDMQDLACLIAPRSFIAIAGKEDDIFPIHGVRRGFETVREIFKANGVEGNCRLVETPKNHWWCEDIVWSAINEEASRLGWR